MKILLTGGTGFLGGPLVQRLAASGHACFILTRNPQRARQAKMLGHATFYSYSESLPSVDVIINLAGESIAGLWTAQKKAAILSSRLQVTRHLIEALRKMDSKPKLLLSASAVGYYGHRPNELLTEESRPDPQKRFRAKVCLEWEAAAWEAQTLGVRTVLLRLSHILHPSGGYLGKLIPLYKRGLCFGFGNPQAHFPWISLGDTLRLIEWIIATETIAGAVNVSTPTQTLRKNMADSLAKMVGRRPLGSFPSWLLQIVLGDFSAALIEDQNVQPKKALAAGFQFLDVDLDRYLSSQEY